MATKAQQARDYKAAHPLASVQHIGEKLDMLLGGVRRALRVTPQSRAHRVERMRAAKNRAWDHLPARRVIRALVASGSTFTRLDVQARAKCSIQSGRSAVEWAVETGLVERVGEHKRGAIGIYRGARAATGSQAA
jgi:hypothetical protein